MIKTVGGDIGMTHSAGHEDHQDFEGVMAATGRKKKKKAG